MAGSGPRAVSEYLLERLIAAGCTKLCFVISPGKSDILAYYGSRIWGVDIVYAVQPTAGRPVRRALPRRTRRRSRGASCDRSARHRLVPTGRPRATSIGPAQLPAVSYRAPAVFRRRDYRRRRSRCSPSRSSIRRLTATGCGGLFACPGPSSTHCIRSGSNPAAAMSTLGRW